MTWARQWAAGCGAVYVLAWLVGLVIAPASPAADASPTAIHAYYAAQPAGVLIQSLLVHGLAGVALAGFTFAVPAVIAGPGRWRLATWVGGFAAALVSLCQAGFAIAATRDVPAAAPARSAWYFHAINNADSLKLLLLGVFVAAASVLLAQAARLPIWLAIVAVVLAPLLPISGAGYLTDNTVLLGLLYVSLPLLLVWTAALSVVVARRRTPIPVTPTAVGNELG